MLIVPLYPQSTLKGHVGVNTDSRPSLGTEPTNLHFVGLGSCVLVSRVPGTYWTNNYRFEHRIHTRPLWLDGRESDTGHTETHGTRVTGCTTVEGQLGYGTEGKGSERETTGMEGTTGEETDPEGGADPRRRGWSGRATTRKGTDPGWKTPTGDEGVPGEEVKGRVTGRIEAPDVGPGQWYLMGRRHVGRRNHLGDGCRCPDPNLGPVPPILHPTRRTVSPVRHTSIPHPKGRRTTHHRTAGLPSEEQEPTCEKDSSQNDDRTRTGGCHTRTETEVRTPSERRRRSRSNGGPDTNHKSLVVVPCRYGDL